MGRKLTITIGYDQDTDNPTQNDGAWKLYSFSTRHVNFKHPDHFFTENRKLKTKYSNKVRVGLAFLLGYHEHGNCQWALSGEQQPCQWDSVNVAGILIWEEPASNMGAKTKEDRAKDARSFLEEYTNWCNGECYYYSIEDENGNDCGGCGGLIGADTLFDCMSEDIETGDVWEFKGECKDVASYYEKKLHEMASELRPWTVTISGTEREDGEKPYTFVVMGKTKTWAINAASKAAYRDCEIEYRDQKVEEVKEGVPPANCGYYWNDCREKA